MSDIENSLEPFFEKLLAKTRLPHAFSSFTKRLWLNDSNIQNSKGFPNSVLAGKFRPLLLDSYTINKLLGKLSINQLEDKCSYISNFERFSVNI